MNSLKEQMEAAFAKFDKDKTGRINYTEFCTMLNKNNKWNTHPIMDTMDDRGSSCVQS